MVRTDLIAAIGADNQQMADIGMYQQIGNQSECRRIQPLEIVEKQHQRVLRPGEDAEEPPKNDLEAALRVLRRQIGDRRLGADDQFQFGDQVDHQLAVLPQRFGQRVAPVQKVGFRLAEQLVDQALKGLRDGRVWNATLVLVELAGREKAAGRDQDLVQFVDHRRLAEPRIAGDERKHGILVPDDLVETSDEGVDLCLASVELFRNDQPVGNVPLSERERLDAPMALPLGEAMAQVCFDAKRSLVAFLPGLGEQLHGNLRQRSRHAGQPVGGRLRRPCNMAVHPFQRFGCHERQGAREHPVERYAE